MADLSMVGIDENVEEAGGASTLLPDGWFPAVIVGTDYGENSKKTGTRLLLEIQIISGKYTAEIIKDNLNITNPSDDAQRIGQGILKKICRIVNAPFPPTDTDSQLCAKKISIKNKLSSFISRKGEELPCNSIVDYKEYDETGQLYHDSLNAPSPVVCYGDKKQQAQGNNQLQNQSYPQNNFKQPQTGGFGNTSSQGGW